MNDLVFDRMQSDVTNKTWKGYYNASDLNRVESWCKYLADELNIAGYNINITTKLNWVQTDLRTSAEMERIRTNIKAIMTGFHYITQIYQNANQFDFEKANNWEKILFEIYNLMWGMQDWYVYSGVSNSAQPRLWQNKFRHYFVPASPDIPYTTIDYIESTGTQYIDTGVTGGNNLRVEVKVLFTTTTPTPVDTIVCGRDVAYNATITNNFTLMRNTQTKLYDAYGSQLVTTNATLNANTEYEIVKNKNKLYVNGTLVQTDNVETFTFTNNMWLFASYQRQLWKYKV